MAKQLVVAFMSNQIYYANILKDGTMGARTELTQDCIRAVMEHMYSRAKYENKNTYTAEGFGTLTFTPAAEQK